MKEQVFMAFRTIFLTASMSSCFLESAGKSTVEIEPLMFFIIIDGNWSPLV